MNILNTLFIEQNYIIPKRQIHRGLLRNLSKIVTVTVDSNSLMSHLQFLSYFVVSWMFPWFQRVFFDTLQSFFQRLHIVLQMSLFFFKPEIKLRIIGLHGNLLRVENPRIRLTHSISWTYIRGQWKEYTVSLQSGKGLLVKCVHFAPTYQRSKGNWDTGYRLPVVLLSVCL